MTSDLVCNSYSGCVNPFCFFLQRAGRRLSDQQYALLIVFGFTMFAVVVAVGVQQMMAWGGQPS